MRTVARRWRFMPGGAGASAVAIAASLAATVAGCRGDPPSDRRGAERAAPASAAPAAPIPEITVGELAALLARGAAQAVDANTHVTRERMGVIPGAILLPETESLAGLPPDRARSLVFYCSNDACRASHDAARRAIAAGYTRVQLLPAGIAGWVKAGQATAAP